MSPSFRVYGHVRVGRECASTLGQSMYVKLGKIFLKFGVDSHNLEVPISLQEECLKLARWPEGARR